jgi:tRNA pseudouridine38-40 synthase
MRYFIELSYKGTNFHGWQMQGNAYTVQAEINRALAIVFRRNVSTYGCGRTDAGVHARQFFAQFDNPDAIEQPDNIVQKLNSILHKDICISRVLPVGDTASTRFDATARTYKYFISTYKNPFRQEFAWHIPYHLNVSRMNAACLHLLAATEFGAFMKAHSEAKTTTCYVSQAHFEVKRKEHLVIFTITANRFLRNMVRAIVGTLVNVGNGNMMPDNMADIIASQDRSRAGGSAPAEGLFLWQVRYPYINE